MALIIADRVRETTATQGTGALALGGTITGFRTFSSACSVGDTCYYALQEVDATGNPAGAWEVGLGTYSAANTLTRTTVLSSSNANAAVGLTAATTQVWIDIAAGQLYKIFGKDAPSTGGAGSDVTITAGSSAGAGQNAGSVTITAGANGQTGNAGNVTIKAGQGGPSAAAGGGTVTVQGGSGGSSSGPGGSVTVSGGTATSGAGGAVAIQGANGAGSSSGSGGGVTITAGNGAFQNIPGTVTIQGGGAGQNTSGGAVNITGGSGAGTGYGGNIVMTPGGLGAGRGNVVTNGTNSALATTAVGGFLTIPLCAGAPTGTPANVPAGNVAMVYDTTNNKLWIYNGAWKSVALA